MGGGGGGGGMAQSDSDKFNYNIYIFSRLLDWVERDTRKKHERVVVFKNMFDIEDFEVCVSSSTKLT